MRIKPPPPSLRNPSQEPQENSIPTATQERKKEKTHNFQNSPGVMVVVVVVFVRELCNCNCNCKTPMTTEDDDGGR